jgi:hypothetical protein
MVNLGRPETKVLADDWTAVTRDKSLSAQFDAARKQCRFADAQCGCELENPLLQMLLPCDRVALAPGWTTTLQHRIGGRCESRRARLEYLRGHWRRRIHRSNLSSVGCP